MLLRSVHNKELISDVHISSAVIPTLLLTTDASVILLSSLVGGAGYHWWIGVHPELFGYCAIGLLASFIYVLRISGTGHYDLPECAKPHVEISAILICWFTTGLLLALFAFLLKIGVQFSRGAFVIFYFVAPIGLLGVRQLTKIALARAVAARGLGRRDLVLVGDYNEISGLGPEDLIAFFGAPDIKRFTLSHDDVPLTRVSNDVLVLNLVVNFVRANNCREILLAVPWGDAGRMEVLRAHLKVVPVAVRLLPDKRVRMLTNYCSSARRRVLAIEIQRAPLTASERLVKRAMDIVLSSIALILLLPIMVLAAIAIRLEGPGPIIFRQHRKGFNGKQFVMLKFRTMTVLEDGALVAQATRHDPRITSIGRLLRSTSIDELPQLINVLTGDMSLIGPRPHALAHDKHFESLLGDYAYRHNVKPGITGWAQCNGARGATPTIEHISERVRLDLWYINNWSLWLDLLILMKTLCEVFRKRNAY